MKRFSTLALLALAGWTPAHRVDAAPAPDPAVALERFVRDYAEDPSWTTASRFGVEVDGRRWHVVTRPADGAQAKRTELVAGFPAEPIWFFTTDAETLARLDAGELNALTAMGKARESDAAPMDVGVVDGFAPGPEFAPELLATCFHFWTRGLPERIPFGPATTRTVHGAQATLFYYQPGFRSGYFEIRPGQHANADPADQINAFPSLFVPIRGHAKARIAGREIDLVAGEAIFIPPGTPHEFWNPYAEPAEGILMMFGDGA